MRMREVIPNMEAAIVIAEEEVNSIFPGTDAELWQEMEKVAASTTVKEALLHVFLVGQKYNCTIGAIEREMVESNIRRPVRTRRYSDWMVVIK
jgi:hypothetical protein